MAKINFATLTGEKAITEATDKVAGDTSTAQLNIHYILVAIAADWASDGDIRTVVKQTNYLLTELADGIRKNAIVQWCTSTKLLGLVWNDETKELVASGMKAKNLDLRLIGNTRWWEFKEPPVPQPYDLGAEFTKLVAKASTRNAKSKKGDKIDPILLAQLSEIKAALAAGKFVGVTAPLPN